MNYEFVWLDSELKETKSIKKGSGCWGALGRFDYYEMNQTHRAEFLEFCKAAGFSVSTASRERSGYLRSDAPDAIKLTASDFRNMFHKTSYELMKYVVEESLFNFLFFGIGYDTYYKNNMLYVDCNKVPAQIAATFLIWARDIFCDPNAGLCFSTLVASGLDKGTALYLSVTCSGIYRGSTYLTFAEAMSRSAPLEVFVDNPSLDTWNKYLHVYPRSLNEFMGYPTILIQQWNKHKVTGLRIPDWNAVKKLATTQKLSGVFGDIKFSGVTDINMFVKKLFSA